MADSSESKGYITLSGQCSAHIPKMSDPSDQQVLAIDLDFGARIAEQFLSPTLTSSLMSPSSL
jgi:hypothetical protein